jgi:hypothetical protein
MTSDAGRDRRLLLTFQVQPAVNRPDSSRPTRRRGPCSSTGTQPPAPGAPAVPVIGSSRMMPNSKNLASSSCWIRSNLCDRLNLMATGPASSRAADAPLTLDFDRATAIEWGAAAGGVAFTQYFGQQQLAARSDDAAADEADANVDADSAAEMHDSRPEPVPISIIALGATGAGKSTLLARIDAAQHGSPFCGAAADVDAAADSSRAHGMAADSKAYRPTAGIDFRLRVRPWASGVAVKLQVRREMNAMTSV